MLIATILGERVRQDCNLKSPCGRRYFEGDFSPASRPAARRTLINLAVDVRVKFFAWNDEPSPDLQGCEFLRPDRLADRPDCTRAVDSGLFDGKQPRSYG